MNKPLVQSAVLLMGCFFLMCPIWADDYTPDHESSLSQRVLMLEQRLSVHQQRMVLDQITTLQQQIDELRGQLEVYAHEVHGLTAQQRADVEKNPHQDGQGSEVSTTEAYAAYRSAFLCVQQKQYVKAIDRLKVYIKQYPDSLYVPNAYYWLGEIYTLQGQLALAVDAFNQIIDKYPKSSKNSKALLHSGMVLGMMGKKAQAKAVLERLVSLYPNTEVARLASIQLTAYTH